jgi:hypothetical protein
MITFAIGTFPDRPFNAERSFRVLRTDVDAIVVARAFRADLCVASDRFAQERVGDYEIAQERSHPGIAK